jgi:dTMP kinase
MHFLFTPLIFLAIKNMFFVLFINEVVSYILNNILTKINFMYIVFEGIDGAGKSTQIQLLKEWLEANGLEVETIVEPTDSEVGKLIRKILQRHDATTDRIQKTLGLLFAADRMLIMDKLSDEKKVILSDRSFISSLAYQEPAEWIQELNKYAKKPDLVLLLDLDVKTSVARTSGEDEFENEEFLTTVKANYLKIINDFNHEIIDANNGINKVSSDIKKAVAPHVGLCRDCIL